MKKSFNIVCFIVTVMILNACKPDPKDYYINQTAKEWGLFKSGSWWCYVDSTLQKQDSLYIESVNDHAIYYDSDKIRRTYHAALLKVFNSQNSLYMDWDVIGNEHYTQLYVTRYINNSNYVAELLLFNTQPVQTDNSTLTKFDSVKVMGIWYKDVCQIHCSFKTSSDMNAPEVFTNDYWLAKGKWLIKRVERTPTDTTVWLLEKYNIVR